MNITSAKQIFKNASCIDFRMLVRSNNVFNKNHYSRIKSRIAEQGSAGIVVHPLFFNDFVKSSKELISDNYFVQQAINEESYSKYANNLRNFLNTALFPVFIFYDPKAAISLNNPFIQPLFNPVPDRGWINTAQKGAGFIQDVNTNTPLIFVKTESDEPTPKFLSKKWPSGQSFVSDYDYMFNPDYMFNVERSWNLLRNTFLDLGVKNLIIGGEKGYIEESGDYISGKDEIGCVYSLAKSLRRMGFNCTVDINMVFPGVTVSVHSEK